MLEWALSWHLLDVRRAEDRVDLRLDRGTWNLHLWEVLVKVRRSLNVGI